MHEEQQTPDQEAKASPPTDASTAGGTWDSNPYLRSRQYSCIREIPSLRDAWTLLPFVSRITRSIARRSIKSRSVVSAGAGDGDHSDRSSGRIDPSSHMMLARSRTL